MKLSIIAALGQNRELGKDGQLIWRISEDLKLFKKLTMGHPIIMGRKTFESIGRVLPGRTGLVLSSSAKKLHPDVIQCRDVDQVMDYLKENNSCGLAWVIGGEQIYRLFLPLVESMYLTHIHAGDHQADCFFPEFSEDQWQKAAQQDYPESQNHPAWSHIHWQRRH